MGDIIIPVIVIYFEFMWRAFQKRRVIFRLDKFHVLLDFVEYIGHDLKAESNYPI